MHKPKPPVTLVLLLLAIGPPGGKGDVQAFRELHAALLPVVQARVAKVLFKRAPRGRDPVQERDDLIHEVFVHLIERDFHVLRTWDPSCDGAASMENWVGLVAERVVGGVLRGKKWSPWTSDPTDGEMFEQLADEASSVEERLGNAEYRKGILDLARRSLTPKGLVVFDLWVKGRTVYEICVLTGMTRGAVDRWMARFRDLIKKIRERYPG